MIPNIEEYYESFRKFNQNQKMKKKKKKKFDKKTLITEITTTKMLCFYSIQYIPKAKMLNMAKNKKLK